MTKHPIVLMDMLVVQVWQSKPSQLTYVMTFRKCIIPVVITEDFLDEVEVVLVLQPVIEEVEIRFVGHTIFRVVVIFVVVVVDLRENTKQETIGERRIERRSTIHLIDQEIPQSVRYVVA